MELWGRFCFCHPNRKHSVLSASLVSVSRVYLPCISHAPLSAFTHGCTRCGPAGGPRAVRAELSPVQTVHRPPLLSSACLCARCESGADSRPPQPGLRPARPGWPSAPPAHSRPPAAPPGSLPHPMLMTDEAAWSSRTTALSGRDATRARSTRFRRIRESAGGQSAMTQTRRPLKALVWGRQRAHVGSDACPGSHL